MPGSQGPALSTCMNPASAGPNLYSQCRYVAWRMMIFPSPPSNPRYSPPRPAILGVQARSPDRSDRQFVPRQAQIQVWKP